MTFGEFGQVNPSIVVVPLVLATLPAEEDEELATVLKLVLLPLMLPHPVASAALDIRVKIKSDFTRSSLSFL